MLGIVKVPKYTIGDPRDYGSATFALKDLAYLEKRLDDLTDELIQRGVSVQVDWIPELKEVAEVLYEYRNLQK